MNIQRWCQYFFEVSCLQIQELGFIYKKSELALLQARFSI